ncbi:metal ABC transporter permease, partial [Salmonella enterica subsp. enterica serovar Cerro]|nr:metal ABC transporter permease [Salmonella enterica subsp. enterica serovar Cerro]
MHYGLLCMIALTIVATLKSVGIILSISLLIAPGAARYGQGLSNMLEANPGVDVFLPQSGSTLVVPQQLILPDTVR